MKSPDPIPLSLLNDYLFCQRRAALKTIEGWRGANEHTVIGDIVHEQADISGSSGKWGGAASQRQAMETAALCKPWKNK